MKLRILRLGANRVHAQKIYFEKNIKPEKQVLDKDFEWCSENNTKSCKGKEIHKDHSMKMVG